MIWTESRGTRKIEPMGKIVNRLNDLMAAKRESRPDLKVTDVAYETKLAYNTIQKWLKDQVDRYDKETLATLCEYFECKPGDILDYIE
jgi:DNA-binding Xre family transcriptional regulator